MQTEFSRRGMIVELEEVMGNGVEKCIHQCQKCMISSRELCTKTHDDDSQGMNIIFIPHKVS
jgi:hypothetical protein